MTGQEFSDQFDVLYNNITSNQAPGLNEYEKSVFLTKAQEEIVKNYFSAKANPKGDGFDDSPKRQADFSTLIKTETKSLTTTDSFDQRAKNLTMPSDLFIALNEQLMDGTTPITVVPISYEEYTRLMAKPYKFPPKYQAWRLITNKSTTSTPSQTINGIIEYSLDSYSGYNGKKIGFTNTLTLPVNLVVKKRVVGDPDGNYVIEDVDNTRKVTLIIPSTPGMTLTAYKLSVIDETPSITSILKDLQWPDEDTAVDYYNLPTVICNITAPAQVTTEPSTIQAPVAEIIGRFSSVSPVYRIRYIKRPNPIILVNLSGIQNSLTIQGQSTAMTSELSEELHEEILQRAVELAKIAWEGTPTSSVQAGQRSE